MKKTALFILLTYGVCATMAALFVAAHGKLNSGSGLAFLVLYMFMPMSMATIVQRGIYRQPIMEPLGIAFRPNAWWFVGWLLPLVITFATFGVSLLLPGISYSPHMSGILEQLKHRLTPEQYALAKQQLALLSPAFVLGFSVIAALIAGLTVNAVAAFGEELGWRGFLQTQFANMTFWPAALLIGVIWGAWHAPVILMGYNYPHNPRLGVLAMIVLTILLAPIFSYIRLRGKSVIASSILHGTINGSAGISILYVQGGGEFVVGTTGLAGFIVLALVNLALIIYDGLSAQPIMNRRVSEIIM